MAAKLDYQKLVKEWMHGSGFDCDAVFNITRTKTKPRKGYIVVHHAYHCMDEHGYYDGWCTFTVKIPVKSPIDFSISYADRYSRYKRDKHMLQEFIEDSIVNVFYNAGVVTS